MPDKIDIQKIIKLVQEQIPDSREIVSALQKGDIVIDLLKDGRIGGIEFMDLIR